MNPRIRDLGNKLYQIESDSEPGTYYTIDLVERICECKGFQYRGSCKHLQRIEGEQRVRDVLAERKEADRMRPELKEMNEAFQDKPKAKIVLIR